MFRLWYGSVALLSGNPRWRAVGLTFYYLGILLGLLLLYGKRHFVAPPFIYQGF